MTYREYVNKPLILRRRIEHKIEDVELKWAICQTTTSQLGERVQSSQRNSTEANYVRYVDAQKELDQLAAELENARNQVRDFFYENLSEQDADILEWRYIGGKSLQDIAEIVGVEYQTIKNRMSAANKSAREAYEEKVNS